MFVLDGETGMIKITIIKTDVGIIHDAYIYAETTLEEYFELIDPHMMFWHHHQNYLLDNHDSDLTLFSFGIDAGDTLFLFLRTEHPWWRVPTRYEEVKMFEEETDTWMRLYG